MSTDKREPSELSDDLLRRLLRDHEEQLLSDEDRAWLADHRQRSRAARPGGTGDHEAGDSLSAAERDRTMEAFRQKTSDEAH